MYHSTHTFLKFQPTLPQTSQSSQHIPSSQFHQICSKQHTANGTQRLQSSLNSSPNITQHTPSSHFYHHCPTQPIAHSTTSSQFQQLSNTHHAANIVFTILQILTHTAQTLSKIPPNPPHNTQQTPSSQFHQICPIIKQQRAHTFLKIPQHSPTQHTTNTVFKIPTKMPHI
jgi:hypothetical protein